MAYLISLGAGVLAGCVYGLLNVRSPAPPLIALCGLLGILLGEQAVPLVRHLMTGGALNLTWLQSRAPHLLGTLPVCSPAALPKPEADRHVL